MLSKYTYIPFSISLQKLDIFCRKFVKEKSKSAVEKATPYVQSGAEKAKTTTVRGANKVTNSTAKGLKKAGEKLQKSAERTIEKTDKTLKETAPKCRCGCGENCDCLQCDE